MNAHDSAIGEAVPVSEVLAGAQLRREQAASGAAARPVSGRLVLLLVGTLLLFVALPTVATVLRPKVYGGQVDLVLQPRPELSDTAAERATTTEELVVKSSTVLSPVARSAGLSLQAMQHDVSTELVARSNVLRITVAGPTRPGAVALAQAVSSSYIRSRPTAGVHRDPPLLTIAALGPARSVKGVLSPQPLRAVALGTILGLFAGAVVLLVALRPRVFTHPRSYWD